MSELKHFNDLAEIWWDEHGDLATLHKINPLRLAWMQNSTEFHDKKVLDVGCGAGILTEALAHAGADCLGIDLAQNLIRVAQQHAALTHNNANYQCISSRALASSKPQFFDIVVCMELLEHVDDGAAIVQDCAQLVKPGGWVFFSTINRTWQAFISVLSFAEDLLAVIPQGTHHYEKFIRPSELKHWAYQVGLTLHQLQGFTWNPINQKTYLSQSVNANYLMAFKLPNLGCFYDAQPS